MTRESKKIQSENTLSTKVGRKPSKSEGDTHSVKSATSGPSATSATSATASRVASDASDSDTEYQDSLASELDHYNATNLKVGDRIPVTTAMWAASRCGSGQSTVDTFDGRSTYAKINVVTRTDSTEENPTVAGYERGKVRGILNTIKNNIAQERATQIRLRADKVCELRRSVGVELVDSNASARKVRRTMAKKKFNSSLVTLEDIIRDIRNVSGQSEGTLWQVSAARTRMEESYEELDICHDLYVETLLTDEEKDKQETYLSESDKSMTLYLGQVNAILQPKIQLPDNSAYFQAGVNMDSSPSHQSGRTSRMRVRTSLRRILEDAHQGNDAFGKGQQGETSKYAPSQLNQTNLQSTDLQGPFNWNSRSKGTLQAITHGASGGDKAFNPTAGTSKAGKRRGTRFPDDTDEEGEAVEENEDGSRRLPRRPRRGDESPSDGGGDGGGGGDEPSDDEDSQGYPVARPRGDYDVGESIKDALLTCFGMGINAIEHVKKFDGKSPHLFRNFMTQWVEADKVLTKTKKSRVVKLQQLKSCLTGQALYFVNALDESDPTNYTKAIAILRQVYENPVLYIQKIVEGMINSKQLPDTAQGMRTFYQQLLQMTQELAKVDLSAEMLLFLFYITICTKYMPESMKREWTKTTQRMYNPNHPLGTDATMEDLKKVVVQTLQLKQRREGEGEGEHRQKGAWGASRNQNQDKPGWKPSQKKSPQKGFKTQPAKKAWSSKTNVSKKPKQGSKPFFKVRKASSNAASGRVCPICTKPMDHNPAYCPVLKNMSGAKILDIQQSKKLCTICMNPGHMAKLCKLGVCMKPDSAGKKCGMTHHSTLHDKYSAKPRPQANQTKKFTKGKPGKAGAAKNYKSSPPYPKKKGPKANTLTATPAKKKVQFKNRTLLMRIVCELITDDGQMRRVKCLVDPGSDIMLVRTKLADQLRLPGPTQPLELEVAGGYTLPRKMARRVKFRLGNIDGSYVSRRLTATTSDVVSTTVNGMPYDPRVHKHLKDLVFTEDFPTHESDMDIMIDMSLYRDIISGQGGIIEGKYLNEPACQRTKLGNALMGVVSYARPMKVTGGRANMAKRKQSQPKKRDHLWSPGRPTTNAVDRAKLTGNQPPLTTRRTGNREFWETHLSTLKQSVQQGLTMVPKDMVPQGSCPRLILPKTTLSSTSGAKFNPGMTAEAADRIRKFCSHMDKNPRIIACQHNVPMTGLPVAGTVMMNSETGKVGTGEAHDYLVKVPNVTLHNNDKDGPSTMSIDGPYVNTTLLASLLDSRPFKKRHEYMTLGSSSSTMTAPGRADEPVVIRQADIPKVMATQVEPPEGHMPLQFDRHIIAKAEQATDFLKPVVAVPLNMGHLGWGYAAATMYRNADPKHKVPITTVVPGTGTSHKSLTSFVQCKQANDTRIPFNHYMVKQCDVIDPLPGYLPPYGSVSVLTMQEPHRTRVRNYWKMCSTGKSTYPPEETMDFVLDLNQNMLEGSYEELQELEESMPDEEVLKDRFIQAQATLLLAEEAYRLAKDAKVIADQWTLANEHWAELMDELAIRNADQPISGGQIDPKLFCVPEALIPVRQHKCNSLKVKKSRANEASIVVDAPQVKLQPKTTSEVRAPQVKLRHNKPSATADTRSGAVLPRATLGKTVRYMADMKHAKHIVTCKSHPTASKLKPNGRIVPKKPVCKRVGTWKNPKSYVGSGKKADPNATRRVQLSAETNRLFWRIEKLGKIVCTSRTDRRLHMEKLDCAERQMKFHIENLLKIMPANPKEPIEHIRKEARVTANRLVTAMATAFQTSVYDRDYVNMEQTKPLSWGTFPSTMTMTPRQDFNLMTAEAVANAPVYQYKNGKMHTYPATSKFAKQAKARDVALSKEAHETRSTFDAVKYDPGWCQMTKCPSPAQKNKSDLTVIAEATAEPKPQITSRTGLTWADGFAGLNKGEFVLYDPALRKEALAKKCSKAAALSNTSSTLASSVKAADNGPLSLLDTDVEGLNLNFHNCSISMAVQKGKVNGLHNVSHERRYKALSEAQTSDEDSNTPQLRKSTTLTTAMSRFMSSLEAIRLHVDFHKPVSLPDIAVVAHVYNLVDICEEGEPTLTYDEYHKYHCAPETYFRQAQAWLYMAPEDFYSAENHAREMYVAVGVYVQAIQGIVGSNVRPFSQWDVLAGFRPTQCKHGQDILSGKTTILTNLSNPRLAKQQQLSISNNPYYQGSTPNYVLDMGLTVKQYKQCLSSVIHCVATHPIIYFTKDHIVCVEIRRLSQSDICRAKTRPYDLTIPVPDAINPALHWTKGSCNMLKVKNKPDPTASSQGEGGGEGEHKVEDLEDEARPLGAIPKQAKSKYRVLNTDDEELSDDDDPIQWVEDDGEVSEGEVCVDDLPRRMVVQGMLTVHPERQAGRSNAKEVCVRQTVVWKGSRTISRPSSRQPPSWAALTRSPSSPCLVRCSWKSQRSWPTTSRVWEASMPTRKDWRAPTGPRKPSKPTGSATGSESW